MRVIAVVSNRYDVAGCKSKVGRWLCLYLGRPISECVLVQIYCRVYVCRIDRVTRRVDVSTRAKDSGEFNRPCGIMEVGAFVTVKVKK